MSDRLGLARRTAATIDGWLTDREGELLFRLADLCPRGAAIVEIGSWEGEVDGPARRPASAIRD